LRAQRARLYQSKLSSARLFVEIKFTRRWTGLLISKHGWTVKD